MRGQAVVEWMVILSVAMLVLAIMLSMNEDNMAFFNNNMRVGKVKAALNDLKNAVDFVYSQGRDARTRLFITIPDSANLTVSTLPDGSGHIQATVYLSGRQEYYDVYTQSGLAGVIPSKAGGYCMDVEYGDSAVTITRSNASC